VDVHEHERKYMENPGKKQKFRKSEFIVLYHTDEKSSHRSIMKSSMIGTFIFVADSFSSVTHTLKLLINS